MSRAHHPQELKADSPGYHPACCTRSMIATPLIRAITIRLSTCPRSARATPGPVLRKSTRRTRGAEWPGAVTCSYGRFARAADVPSVHLRIRFDRLFTEKSQQAAHRTRPRPAVDRIGKCCCPVIRCLVNPMPAATVILGHDGRTTTDRSGSCRQERHRPPSRAPRRPHTWASRTRPPPRATSVVDECGSRS